MAVLEKIDHKLADSKPITEDELNKMTNVIKIIDDALKALADDNKLIEYDFDIAINLINQNVTNFGIIDLEKGIKDIKNVLIARHKFKINIDLSYEQKRVIESFIAKLNSYKDELESIIKKNRDNEQSKEIQDHLEDLKKLIEGKGRRKYYTYEMLESLLEVIDYDSLTYQEVEELSNLLQVSKNKDKDSNVTKEEVIELLQVYLGDKLKLDFVDRYSDEICSVIDLANAEKILEFFEKENILNKFHIMGLIQILVKGRFEFIKKFYYEEIQNEDEKIKDIFFEDIMCCVWINEESASRKHYDGIRNSGEKERRDSYSDIAVTSKQDVMTNINLLEDYKDILSDKYDRKNISDLWILTRPPWLLEKNLKLFKEFNITDVKITAIGQTDLEGKIHLAIELGLLNPPSNRRFRNIEKTIPKQRDFALNGKKKKIYSSSILNYFQRNTSQLGFISYSEYIYWFYKMQNSSKEEFYQMFFSDKRAGMRSKEAFDSTEDRKIIGNAREMKRIIDDNFANRFYSSLINKYDTYESVLKEFYLSEYSDDVSPYYKDSILEDELVNNLEEYRSVNSEDENEVNPYTYVFGDTIISRYKVLRNLTILKYKFGYINEDMILSSIAYNSYFSKEVFDEIRDCIRKGRNI